MYEYKIGRKRYTERKMFAGWLRLKGQYKGIREFPGLYSETPSRTEGKEDKKGWSDGIHVTCVGKGTI